MKLNPAERKAIKQLYLSNCSTSIFWCVDTQSRAEAVCRLESVGILVRDRDRETGYPHVCYKINQGATPWNNTRSLCSAVRNRGAAIH